MQFKTILITGGAGSIAKMVIKTLFEINPNCLVIALDNDDTELYHLEQEYSDASLKLTCVLEDIANSNGIEKVCDLYQPDIIIHTAAHKQVSFLEQFKERAYEINTAASLNILISAKQRTIPVIFLSTDKSVEPTSILGYSKWIVECAFKSWKISGCVLRLPNVWDSKGSFFSGFLDVYNRKGFIPITNMLCSRYVLKENQLKCVIKEVFEHWSKIQLKTIVSSNLEQISLKNFIHEQVLSLGLNDSDIRVVGLRPGEKIHEKLVWNSEIRDISKYSSFDAFENIPFRWNQLELDKILKDDCNKVEQIDLIKKMFLENIVVKKFDKE